MISHCYNVVGVTFEGRQDVLNAFYRKYRVGGAYDVLLEKEPNNPYDSNAIAVVLDVGNSDYRQVGYISKQDNVLLGKMLGRLKKASLHSMGPNAKGEIGLTVLVEFEEQQ